MAGSDVSRLQGCIAEAGRAGVAQAVLQDGVRRRSGLELEVVMRDAAAAAAGEENTAEEKVVEDLQLHRLRAGVARAMGFAWKFSRGRPTSRSCGLAQRGLVR